MTNCFRLFGVFAIFLTSITSNAQIADYHLRDYLLPDVKFNAWNINHSLGGNGSDINDHRTNSSLQTSKNGNFLLGGDITSFFNDRSQQHLASFTYNVDGSKWQEKTSRTDNKSDQWGTDLRINVINRFFFDRRVFLEIVPKAHYVFDQYTRIQVFQPSINNRYSSNNYQYGFGLPIKVGLGRLEQVEDARRALFVIHNLAKRNLIDSVSYEDIDELAQLSTQIRWRRYFDWRLQRIYQLETVDSFFRERNIVQEADATYFALLSDFWWNGNQPERNSGWRVSVGYYPFFGRQTEHIRENNSSNMVSRSSDNSNQRLCFGIQGDYHLPLSETWQIGLTTEAYSGRLLSDFGGQNIDGSVNVTGNWRYNFGVMKLNVLVGFYPSTRTYATWNSGVRQTTSDALEKGSVRQFFPNPTVFYQIPSNHVHQILTSNLTVYHYVSPRLRLRLSMTGLSQWNPWEPDSEEMRSAQGLTDNNFADPNQPILFSFDRSFSRQQLFNYGMSTGLTYSIF